jgi:hypothetical protein
MDLRYSLLAAFAAGYLIQGALMLSGAFKGWSQLVGTAKASKVDITFLSYAFGSIFLLMMLEYDFRTVFFPFCFLLAVVFALLPAGAADQTLPPVDEQALLSQTITFWFCLAYLFPAKQLLDEYWPLVGLLTIPTFFTCWFAFFSIELVTGARLLFYVWYMILAVSFAAIQFAFGDLSFFLFEPGVPNILEIKLRVPGLMEVFTSGMAFYYIVGSLSILTMMWFVWSSTDDGPGAQKEWDEVLHTVGSKYSEGRVGPAALVLTLVFQAGFLAANLRHPVVSQPILLDLSMVLAPLLLRLRLRRFAAPVAAPLQARSSA